jgi:ARG and Rhodanese-Phosphatase-superfamily-associated Protein domain
MRLCNGGTALNIAHALEELDLGSAQTFRNLTVVPLVRRSRASGEDEAPLYLTLDEAIARELLFIRELPGAASVPELQAENRGDLPVLLVDGDQLVGAKQNRIINLSILVPSGHTIVIPVSCVEAGRWRFTSDRFRPAEHTLYAQAKAEKLRHVSASLEASGRAASDQGAVWDSIREKIASMDASAPTEAMADIYKRHEASIEEYARAFRPVPGQVGAVFAINGYVAGLELFSHTPMFVAHFLKTLRGFGLDAVDAAGNVDAPANCREARAFVSQIADAATSARTFPGVGLGETVRIDKGDVIGAALVVEGKAVHVTGFRKSYGSGDSRVFQRRSDPRSA